MKMFFEAVLSNEDLTTLKLQAVEGESALKTSLPDKIQQAVHEQTKHINSAQELRIMIALDLSDDEVRAILACPVDTLHPALDERLLKQVKDNLELRGLARDKVI